jgi:hypothetical protein
MRAIAARWRAVVLPAIATLVFATRGDGQDPPRKSSLGVTPAWLSAENGPSSLGARWDGRWTYSGDQFGKTFPRTWHIELTGLGTAALDPDANLETIRFGGDASVFVALYKPSRDTSSNPDAPTAGGFDFGAAYLAVLARLEADQRFDEVARTFGGEFQYLVERQGGLWPLVPSFSISWLSVAPTASALRDSLDLDAESHSRLDVNVIWHVPLFRTPLRAHADLRFWSTSGLAPELKVLDRDEGSRVALGLGWTREWTIGRIRVDEVFVRWSDGSQPVATREGKAWMIGIVANLVK